MMDIERLGPSNYQTESSFLRRQIARQPSLFMTDSSFLEIKFSKNFGVAISSVQLITVHFFVHLKELLFI